MAMAYDEFLELAGASRSYRRFDQGRPIPWDDLLALVAAARLAPSGNNMQQLRFRLVTDADAVAYCCAHHGWAARYREWAGPKEGERPCAYIAVCVPRQMVTTPIRLVDVGIAAQTLMLAATARGMGGCMIRSFDATIDERLGLDRQGLACALLLALGYPAETVELDDAQGGDVAYWRDGADVHHVPKLSVKELLA